MARHVDAEQAVSGTDETAKDPISNGHVDGDSSASSDEVPFEEDGVPPLSEGEPETAECHFDHDPDAEDAEDASLMDSATPTPTTPKTPSLMDSATASSMTPRKRHRRPRNPTRLCDRQRWSDQQRLLR